MSYATMKSITLTPTTAFHVPDSYTGCTYIPGRFQPWTAWWRGSIVRFGETLAEVEAGLVAAREEAASSHRR